MTRRRAPQRSNARVRTAVSLDAGADIERLRHARTVVALGLLAAMLIAPGLWFAHPFLTNLAPVPLLPALPALLDVILYGTLLVLLLPIALLRRPGVLIPFWCGLFAIKAATDLSLWQPYFYQYVVMLLVACQAGRGRQNDTPPAAALNILRLIMVVVYLWSGLNKLNHRFLTAGVAALPGLEETLAPISQWLPAGALDAAALFLPLVEIGVGCGLLLPSVRRAAAGVAMAMHLVLLLLLGPLGRNLNEIVWPWNLAMLGLVGLLFLPRTSASPRAILWNPTSRAYLFVFALFVVGPFLGLFGLWPESLSFKLYSHRFALGDIYVKEPLRAALPAAVRAQFQPVSVSFDTPSSRLGPYVAGVSVTDWSERELNAFLPSDMRVYMQVFERICGLELEPADALLLIVSPPDVWTGSAEQSIVLCPPR